MPCDMMSGYTAGDSAMVEVRRLKAEGDKATRILCAVLRALDAAGQLPDDEDVREWYREHRVHDERQGRP